MEMFPGGSVTSPGGFRAAGVAAGLKGSGKPDLALLYSEMPACFAAAFTTNRMAAAPVLYGRDLCRRRESLRAVVVNSGNANACTGTRGRDDVLRMASHTAACLELADSQDVLVSSTGIIGQPLPIHRVCDGISTAAAQLSANGGPAAAKAIMTTDTVPKSLAATTVIGDCAVTVGGMAKGAGMIAPRMTVAPHATLLAYLTTDANVAPTLLRQALSAALDESFNRISVDGDMSTNDTVVVLANGAAGNPLLQPDSPDAARFGQLLTQVAGELARQLVLDGEGATRFVAVTVKGAKDRQEAERCARSIAGSLLCKTAWFGGDPNWGRVVDAAGYADVALDPARLSLHYGDLPIVLNGIAADTPLAAQQQAVAQPELALTVDLGVGRGDFTMWTCDLSYDYVKINAEYHT